MTTPLTFSRMASDPGKWRALGLIAAILAFAIAVGAAVGESATGARAGKAPDGTPSAGVFTGRYANGVPIYLLPPVAVFASRNGEIAKMEREEQRTHATYGRADDARRTN